MAKTPNSAIRSAYRNARAVIAREEKRELTQREFLDVAVGNNPRTGKPYNTRTLRKWLADERRADRAVARAEQGGGIIQQVVEDEQGNRYSVTVANPVGQSRLKMFTRARRRDITRAVKRGASERYLEDEKANALTDSERQLRRAKSLKLAGARSVKKAKHVTVIRVRKPRGK